MTSMRSSTGQESLIERATPEPTVLSTVWEGPPGVDGGHGRDDSPVAVDCEETADRSPLLGWLLEPTTRFRALVITSLAAVVCAGAVTAFELYDDVLPPIAPMVETGAASTQGTLGSRAVAVEPGGSTADHADATVSPLPADGRRAVSADNRLQLTAVTPSPGGGWLVEAEILTAASPGPAVLFTVNGEVVAEIEQAPYRFALDSETVGLRSDVVVESGQPLIVTAAVRSSTGDITGPATLILDG